MDFKMSVALFVAKAHRVGYGPRQRLLGVQKRGVIGGNDVALYLFWWGVAKSLRDSLLAFGAAAAAATAATYATTTSATTTTTAADSSLLPSFPQLHQILRLHTDK